MVNETVAIVTQHSNAALWITNLKNKDEYTAIHCINVCILAIAFANHLGIGGKQLKDIGLGALLHDIGKMCTPPEILNKPGSLTFEEFEIMKRHPVEGYEALISSGNIHEPVLSMVRNHHERISGNGYVGGLTGNQIDQPTMIIAIADVYDAMTSDRVYRSAMAPHESLNIIYEISPRDFGQTLAEEFIHCIGIYPVGSVVELASGALGVVFSAEYRHRLKPQVLLIRDPDGNNYDEPRIIDLAELTGKSSWRNWRIERIIEPEDSGIDMAQIAWIYLDDFQSKQQKRD